MGAISPHPCAPRVPIYPVRYSVIPINAKQETSGHNKEAYTHADLETGYPYLDRGQYTLRLVREGFIYLYDLTEKEMQAWSVDTDGHFTELKCMTISTEEENQWSDNYSTGSKVRTLSAKENSTVCIGYTDTLFTEKKLTEVKSNKELRDKFMVEINVKQWADEQKSKNTFRIQEIDKLVEDFKQRPADLSWCMNNIEHSFPDASGLHTFMYNRAPFAQIGVALYDNIGMCQDQSILIHYARALQLEYTAEHSREKLIADTITQLYKNSYAANKGIGGPTVEQLDQQIKASEEYLHHLQNGGQSELRNKHYNAMEVEATKQDIRKLQQQKSAIETLSSEEQLEQALAEDISEKKDWYQQQAHYASPEYKQMGHAGRNTKLNARRALASQPQTETGYTSAVLIKHADRLAQHIDEARRVVFLEKYNVDTKVLQTDMLLTKNDRWKLLGSYLDTNKATDLGSSFLSYDQKNPISGGAHAQAFASISESMMADVSAVDGVKNKEHQLFHQWWQMPAGNNPLLDNLQLDNNLLEYALKHKGDSSATAIDAVDGIGSMLAPYFASTEITTNLVLYMHQYRGKGKVVKTVNSMFQKLLNAPEANATQLRILLERNHQLVTGDFKATTDIRQLSPKEYFRQFGRAANLSSANIEKNLHVTGNFTGKQSVITLVHTKDQGKLHNQLDNNPFGGKVSGGVSLLAIMLFSLNLKNAIIEIYHEINFETGSSFFSAVFGVGSGINAMAIALEPALGTRAYARVTNQYNVIKAAKHVAATRFFGHFGAIFEGITQGIRANKAYKAGDDDAGRYYTLAAVNLTVGGMIATEAGIAALGFKSLVTWSFLAVIPVWGWIAAGIILLGVGIYTAFKAAGARDTPIEKWLKNSSFGLGTHSNSIRYPDQEEEYNAFIDALYAPQILDYDWNAELIGTEEVTLDIYQPAKDASFRLSMQGGTELPDMQATVDKDIKSSISTKSGEFNISKTGKQQAGNGYRYTIKVENIPRGISDMRGCLYYIPLLSGRNDNQWVRYCFGLNRGIGLFTNLEQIQHQSRTIE